METLKLTTPRITFHKCPACNNLWKRDYTLYVLSRIIDNEKYTLNYYPEPTELNRCTCPECMFEQEVLLK